MFSAMPTGPEDVPVGNSMAALALLLFIGCILSLTYDEWCSELWFDRFGSWKLPTLVTSELLTLPCGYPCAPRG